MIAAQYQWHPCSSLVLLEMLYAGTPPIMTNILMKAANPTSGTAEILKIMRATINNNWCRNCSVSRTDIR